MKDDSNELLKKIRAMYRKKAGKKSYDTLAEEIGVGKPTLYRFNRDIYRARLKTVWAICKWLDVELTIERIRK